MELTAHDLTTLTETIWDSLLDMPLAPWALDRDAPPIADALAACINFTGGFSGSLSIMASAGLAGRFAQQMYGMDADELDAELVRDAFGELANIAGGNVKAVLAPDCVLGLPVVAEGVREAIHVSSSSLVCEAWLECAGEPMCVVLHERHAPLFGRGGVGEVATLPAMVAGDGAEGGQR